MKHFTWERTKFVSQSLCQWSTSPCKSCLWQGRHGCTSCGRARPLYKYKSLRTQTFFLFSIFFFCPRALTFINEWHSGCNLFSHHARGYKSCVEHRVRQWFKSRDSNQWFNSDLNRHGQRPLAMGIWTRRWPLLMGSKAPLRGAMEMALGRWCLVNKGTFFFFTQIIGKSSYTHFRTWCTWFTEHTPCKCQSPAILCPVLHNFF